MTHFEMYCDREYKNGVERMIHQEFHPIPQEIVQMVIDNNNGEYFEEVTPMTTYDKVLYGDDELKGEIQSIDREEGTAVVEFEDETKTVNLDDLQFDYDEKGYGLPMFGTMWMVDTSYWEDHKEELADSGFKIYDIPGFDDLVVGIDGCGYDFYESHWNKLFDAMEWFHKPTELDMDISKYKAVEFALKEGIKPEKIAKGLDISKEAVASVEKQMKENIR